MRFEVCGNRESRASIDRRVVATDAAGLGARCAGVVLRVVELHSEGFVEARGKILQRRIAALGVGVTDQAHRDRRRRELSAMAVGAGFVTGEARRRGIVGAFVTRGARECAMALAAVKKFRIIRLRTLDHRYTQQKEADFNHLFAIRLICGRWAMRK